jgi:hypothetical protein
VDLRDTSEGANIFGVYLNELTKLLNFVACKLQVHGHGFQPFIDSHGTAFALV